jgi:hypothetical protein
MSARERLSATVEGELLDAGRQAVAEGRADSLSAWVNDALRRQAEHDLRMKALDGFLAEYEAVHGEITATEMHEATRTTQRRSVAVQPRQGRKSAARQSRKAGAA